MSPRPPAVPPILFVLLALSAVQFLGGVVAFFTIHPGDYYDHFIGVVVAALAVLEGGALLVLMALLSWSRRRPAAWEDELARQDAEDAALRDPG